MRKYRSLSMLLLALLLTLTGCSGMEDRLGVIFSGGIDGKAYIQGHLDTLYLGKFTPEYLKMVDMTEGEARANYEDGIEVEVETFISLTNVEYPTEYFKARMAEIYKRIYTKSDYTVVSSAKQDDGSYSVKVTVRPLDTIQLFYEALPDYQEEFEARHADTDVNAMSDAEFDDWYENVYDLDYQSGLADLMESLVDKTGTLKEKSIAVQVEEDTDGYYTLNEEGLSSLDALIIDYN